MRCRIRCCSARSGMLPASSEGFDRQALTAAAAAACEDDARRLPGVDYERSGRRLLIRSPALPGCWFRYARRRIPPRPRRSLGSCTGCSTTARRRPRPCRTLRLPKQVQEMVRKSDRTDANSIARRTDFAVSVAGLPCGARFRAQLVLGSMWFASRVRRQE